MRSLRRWCWNFEIASLRLFSDGFGWQVSREGRAFSKPVFGNPFACNQRPPCSKPCFLARAPLIPASPSSPVKNPTPALKPIVSRGLADPGCPGLVSRAQRRGVGAPNSEAIAFSTSPLESGLGCQGSVHLK